MDENLPLQLRTRLSDRCGAPVRLVKVSSRPNSVVFRADVASPQPLQLAVKCCLDPRTGRPDNDAAAVQYEALQRARPAFAHGAGPYKIPEPWHFEPSLGAFAMSWVAGRSLTREMASGRALFGNTAAWGRAGEWLGRFHGLGPSRPGRFNSTERSAHIADMAANGLDDIVFSRGVRTLLEHAPRVESEPVHLSWLHGDCKCDNILFAGADTYGVDFSLLHENAIEHDLAQFLNHLELLLVHPHHLHLAPLGTAMAHAFLAGYRRTGPPYSLPCLHWVRLWALLSLWRTTLRAQRRKRFAMWIANKTFSRACTRLIRALDQADPGHDAREAVQQAHTP